MATVGEGQPHPSTSEPAIERQLTLFPFPVQPLDPWELLRKDGLSLNEPKYKAIRKCYREIYDSFLPGAQARPFYKQVSKMLESEGYKVSSRAIGRLVALAKARGIADFPDPRDRRVPSSSPLAAKLQNPGGRWRMSQEELIAFAEVYREVQLTWPRKREVGQGFFAKVAAKMSERGFDKSQQYFAGCAQYRRRIGDINFPRIRGSQDIERMQVAAVDRMQSLGVMATGLMHEILQPLQVIQTTAEQQKSELQKQPVDQEKLAERLDRIIKHASSLGKVVQHVRTIARAGEIRTEPVELRSAIENALIVFGQQLRARGIAVDYLRVGEGLPPVFADRVGLERVFINLLLNARDAIEETDRGSGNIQIQARDDGTVVHCDLSDDGIGITEQIIESIFDPYFTTKQVGKGSGMGLTEVFNLMIQCGGKITVNSRPQEGTTFHLEFRKP